MAETRRLHIITLVLVTSCFAFPQDDAVAKKLASMRKKSGVRRTRPRAPAVPAPAQGAAEVAAAAVTLPGMESADVPVWEVPPALRMPDAGPCSRHGRHVSLDDLFPGSGLSEAWDTRAELRTVLRRALRADLFPRPPKWDDRQFALATELGSACMVTWRQSADAAPCEAFSAAFAAHDVALSGRRFVEGMGSLCGSRPHGSLIDIVPLKRVVAHSWHQDCGISSDTVLLGFPPRDEYVGGGVFSSHVKLSHPLRPSEGEQHGAVVEYEKLAGAQTIPEEFVLRPLYGRGREIWVSDDAAHLHSTPDRQLRECLWRFM